MNNKILLITISILFCGQAWGMGAPMYSPDSSSDSTQTSTPSNSDSSSSGPSDDSEPSASPSTYTFNDSFRGLCMDVYTYESKRCGGPQFDGAGTICFYAEKAASEGSAGSIYHVGLNMWQDFLRKFDDRNLIEKRLSLANAELDRLEKQLDEMTPNPVSVGIMKNTIYGTRAKISLLEDELQALNKDICVDRLNLKVPQ